jgi:hypothetical protein
VIDWLQRVSGGQPVLLVAPYHPLVVPDATDIQNAWHYSVWLTREPVKHRVQGFSDAVLRQPPPVIALDPWLINTRGFTLIDWLETNGVDTPAKLNQVRRLIAEQYTRVVFPGLGVVPYGTAFWVRKDRLQPSRLPASGRVEG